MKKEFDEWIAWGKQRKRFIAFYKQRTLDLTEFVRIHPGGKKSLESYIYKDVSDLIFTVYPHKKETTINTLFKYVVGINTSYDQKKKNEKQNSKSINTRSKSKKKVCFRDNIVQNILFKKQSCENHAYNEDSIVKNHANIRKSISNYFTSIEQRKNERFFSKDKHEVSIKLISLSEAQEYMNMVNQKNSQRQQKMKFDQLDLNIKSQDLQQSTFVSKLPEMKVRHIKH